MCNKKARFWESRFFEYSIAHLTLIAARKRHNARDVPSAIPIHFLLYQMNASAYFNRRSPRGERPFPDDFLFFVWCISIHAPRGGSDIRHGVKQKRSLRFQSTLPAGGATDFYWPVLAHLGISIHAPRGGSDTQFDMVRWRTAQFQSTLPAGGATAKHYTMTRGYRYFNPRSPRGERPDCAGIY